MLKSGGIVPSWQETLLALLSATSVEELWSLLLTPHGIGSSAAWDEPYALFQKFHAEDNDGAITTALLVCTDFRWRTASHRLIHKLADSGILDHDELTTMANIFLTEFWTVSIVDGADARRPIWGPLRRWAAARSVADLPAAWGLLLSLAEDFPSRDGAAIAAGVMDAADVVAPKERGRLLDKGLSWGSDSVRLAALPPFERLRGTDAARRRADEDRSEKVRNFSVRSRSDEQAQRLASGRGADQRDGAGSADEQDPPVSPPTRANRNQPRLFD